MQPIGHIAVRTALSVGAATLVLVTTAPKAQVADSQQLVTTTVAGPGLESAVSVNAFVECVPPCDNTCARCNMSTGLCDSLCANPFEPDTSGTTAADGLVALRAATGLQFCDYCLCDPVEDYQGD